MRRQLKTLEQSVWEVAGHRNSAGEANQLLSLLARQRTYAADAEASLRQIQQLHRQLIAEADKARVAVATVEQLVEIKNSALAGSEQTQAAADALQSAEDLHQRLADSMDTVTDARRASEQLLAIESDLSGSATKVEQAQETVSELLQLSKDLDGRSDNVATARTHVRDLLALKDSIISQTTNLADAIETLELTSDLSSQFHDSAASFERIRHWMVEIMTMEPLLQRAQQTLQPLTELGNLRRLSPEQLRSIARVVSGEHRTQVARTPSAPDVEFSVGDLDATTYEFTSAAMMDSATMD